MRGCGWITPKRFAARQTRSMVSPRGRLLVASCRSGSYLAKVEEFPDDYLTRYRHSGHDCPRCGGPIERIEVAGRTGYFCPSCQQKEG